MFSPQADKSTSKTSNKVGINKSSSGDRFNTLAIVEQSEIINDQRRLVQLANKSIKDDTTRNPEDDAPEQVIEDRQLPPSSP